MKGGDDPNNVRPLETKDEVGTEISLGQLAKKHKIDLNNDTLVMVKRARYCTHLCKVDTKEYGLPQTRNRKVCQRSLAEVAIAVPLINHCCLRISV